MTGTLTIVVTIGTEDYDQLITQIEALFTYIEAQQNITEQKN